MSSGNQVPQRTKEVVRERANGRCEVCGRYTPGADIHHRRIRGMGGSKDPSIHNAEALVAVCGWGNTTGCHGDIHGNSSFSMAMGWLISRFNRSPAEEVPIRLWDGMFFLATDGTRTRAEVTEGEELRF